MTGSRSNSVLRANLNWVAITGFGLSATNFVAMAWFARVLGPAVMGDYAVVVTATYLVAAFVSPGFDQAVIRDPENRELIAAAGVATALQVVLLLLASSVIYVFYRSQYPGEPSRLLPPAGLILGAISLSWFANLYAAPIAAKMEYRYLSFVRFASTMGGVAAGISLAWLDYGVYALVTRDLLAALIVFVLMKQRSAMQIGLPKGASGVPKLFVFAKGMWGLNMLERAVLRIEHALMGWFFGKESLGMYFVVRGLVEGLLGFLVTPVQTVLYSHYCRLQERGRLRPRLPRRPVLIYFGVCALAIFVSYPLAGSVLSLALGGAYVPMHPIVVGLVAYASAVLFFENLKVLSMARNRHDRLLRARLAQLLTVVLVFYPLAVWLGVFGAGLASATGAAVLMAVAWRQLRPQLRPALA